MLTEIKLALLPFPLSPVLMWLCFDWGGSLGTLYTRFPAGFPVGRQGDNIWRTEERANKPLQHRAPLNWWYIRRTANQVG